VWDSGPGSGRNIKKEFSGQHIDHRRWVGNVQDERPVATDDMDPIVADDPRAAVDNDAVHRNSGGDRPIPSRVGLLVQIVNAIAQDVQHGSGGRGGSLDQEVPTTLDGSG
jgi:hypothetical protein